MTTENTGAYGSANDQTQILLTPWENKKIFFNGEM
jgi:hypothetical protein